MSPVYPAVLRFLRRNLALLLVAAAAAGTVAAYYHLISLRTPDVPFVTTPQDVVDAMLDVAAITSDDLVYDLGCGDGRIAVTAARKYGPKVVAIDIDPERIRETRQNAEAAGVLPLVTLSRADFFTLDFRPASVVAMYLHPGVIDRLVPQFEQMKPGSRIVSHHFRVPGMKPTKVLQVRSAEDGIDHPVYLYVLPFEKAPAAALRPGTAPDATSTAP